MKFNWGTKLAIAMAAFMIMIIIFVVLMASQKVELVEPDYYPKGQNYQEHMNNKLRADQLPEAVKIAVEDCKLKIIFPAQFEYSKLTGIVDFHHRSESNKDYQTELKPDQSGISTHEIGQLHGRYILQIEWKYNDKTYFSEESLNLP
jgi:hypothetical protein